jgi:hypothetical protein
MDDELVDRKPTLRFNYQGFTTAEQNKVEDTKSSSKQKKIYNCVSVPFLQIHELTAPSDLHGQTSQQVHSPTGPSRLQNLSQRSSRLLYRIIGGLSGWQSTEEMRDLSKQQLWIHQEG